MTDESMKSINQLRNMTKEYEKTINKKFIRTKEGTKMYQMGKTKFLQLARESGALYQINRTCLIEVEVFEAYLKTFRVPGQLSRRRYGIQKNTIWFVP